MICRAWKEGIPDGSRKEELEFKQIEGGSGLQSPGWVWTRVRTVWIEQWQSERPWWFWNQNH